MVTPAGPGTRTETVTGTDGGSREARRGEAFAVIGAEPNESDQTVGPVQETLLDHRSAAVTESYRTANEAR